MTFSTQAKLAVNRLLRPLNVRMESLTAEALERARLVSVAENQGFDIPVYPVPQSFKKMQPDLLFEAIRTAGGALAKLKDSDSNSVGFSIHNSFFGSPDAEVLYAAVGLFAPPRIVEVGSGNSTRLIRQAIRDFGLSTHLTAIDPAPRTDIESFVDEFIRHPVQNLDPVHVANRAGPGDLFLIDSSHQVRTANDVAFLYLRVLPLLRAGTLIHIHDIFLPFEVLQAFVIDNGWDWCEQYIVQALLMDEDAFDVLWAGYYLQRTMPGFNEHFSLWSGGHASGLLVRKR